VEILHGLEGLRKAPRGAALTIGNFDGLHLGHRQIISTCCGYRDFGIEGEGARVSTQNLSPPTLPSSGVSGEGEKRGGEVVVAGGGHELSHNERTPTPALPLGTGRGGLDGCRASAVVVVTFEPHPLTVLRPKAVEPRLTGAGMKQEMITSMGVDAYVVLPPEPAVLNLTAENFLKILSEDVRPKVMVEGPDFTFGKARGGNVLMLEKWAAECGVQFELAEPVTRALLDLKLVRVSSSLTRWLISGGRVRDAAICLGRPYALRGEVVHGFGRGKGLGAPTINLKCEDQLIPADGVYAGRCNVDGNEYPAAISVGDLPTYGDSGRQIEAYLLGYSGDLYGQRLDLEFCDWLREQRKFPSSESLKMQIELDVVQTRRRSRMDPSVPIAM